MLLMVDEWNDSTVVPLRRQYDLLAPQSEGQPPAFTSPERAPRSAAQAVRWIVSLVEPLLSDANRTTVTRGMVALTEDRPEWVVVYLTGLLHDLMHTLPEEDPWRHLSALIDLDQVRSGLPTRDRDQRLARRSSRHRVLPSRTGALLVSPDAEPRPFGTAADASDLVAPGAGDPSTDVGTAALATNLSPLGAALLAMSAHDLVLLRYVVDQTLRALKAAEARGLVDSASESLIASAGAAARWLTHRRRVYAGIDDNFVAVIGFAWVSRADRVLAGEDIAAVGSMAEGGAIPPGSYLYLAGE